jgi:hypothetical protein
MAAEADEPLSNELCPQTRFTASRGDGDNLRQAATAVSF